MLEKKTLCHLFKSETIDVIVDSRLKKTCKKALFPEIITNKYKEKMCVFLA